MGCCGSYTCLAPISEAHDVPTVRWRSVFSDDSATLPVLKLDSQCERASNRPLPESLEVAARWSKTSFSFFFSDEDDSSADAASREGAAAACFFSSLPRAFLPGLLSHLARGAVVTCWRHDPARTLGNLLSLRCCCRALLDVAFEAVWWTLRYFRVAAQKSKRWLSSTL
jgi:hypothetical protein